MQTIHVEKATHKNENRLLLRFQFDKPTIELIKALPGARWSQTLKSWHLPDTIESKVELAKLAGKAIRLRWADNIEIEPPMIISPKPSNLIKQAQKEPFNKANTQEFRKSTESVVQFKSEIEKFECYLTQRRYSPNTINIYTEGLSLFLKYTSKPVLEIDNKDLEQFSHDFVVKNRYSLSFQNQIINAVKLFFRSVYNAKLDVDKVERPRREHKLPNVLSKEEVKRILAASKNIKHRAMLSLIYACGLRRSELLNLRPHDVDINRGLLIVRQSKGNKDRVVPLTAKTLDMIKEYSQTYKPEHWLFEGQKKVEQYSPTSLQEVLKIAISSANIDKPVTLHWLRHSYATHLLESGTDLRYIQELLGHRSSKTTEIYTHVTMQSIQKIRSPFDDL